VDDRIAVVLQPDTAATSADLAELIEEVETVIAKAEKDWIDQTPSLDKGAARQSLMATLVANRLGMSLPKLQARYQEVYEKEQAAAWLAEREAAWLAERDALKHDRDALAEELREVHPDAARKIADLFVRIAANNQALKELNRARPDDIEQHLLSAELHARGLDGFSSNTPSLLTSVCLFDWDSGRQICPPPRPSPAAAFAATATPGYDRRFTADWAKDNERRAARQQAERQLMANFYARQTQQQEERENAEARERFAEGQRNRLVGRKITE
jgi:hypothetical protein